MNLLISIIPTRLIRMIHPVVCFDCRRLLPETTWVKFEKLREERTHKNEFQKKAEIISYEGDISFVDFFEEENIRRHCCRTMYATSIVIDDRI